MCFQSNDIVLLDQSVEERREVESVWKWHEIPRKQAQLAFLQVNCSAELLDLVCHKASLAIVVGTAELVKATAALPGDHALPLFVLPGGQQLRKLKQSTAAIDVLPSKMAVGSALLAFVQLRQFTEVIVLYDHPNELVHLQNFLRESHQPGQLKTLLRPLSHTRDYGPLLKDLLHRYPTAFNSTKRSSPALAVVLQTSLQTSQQLLSQAHQLGMCGCRAEFVLTNLESLASLDLNEGVGIKHCNVTTFSVVDPTHALLPGIRLQLREGGARLPSSMISTRVAALSHIFLLLKKALKMAKRKHLFDRNEQQSDNCERTNPQLAAFRQLVLDASALDDKEEEVSLSGPLLLTSKGVRHFDHLFVLTRNTSGQMSKYATWNSSSPAQLTPEKKQAVETSLTDDLDGKVLKVTVILEEPFVMLKSQAKQLNLTGNEQYEGYCIDLLDMIAKMKNFTYQIHEVKDKTYGVKEAPPSRWNGMVGELQSKEADLAVASFTITYSRSEVIDFTVPYMHLGISILFKRPETTQPGIFNFTSPMAWDVWLAMLFAYILTSTLLWLMAKLSPNENFVFFNLTPLPATASSSSIHPTNISEQCRRGRSRSSITMLFQPKQKRRKSQAAIPKTHKFTLLNSLWFTGSDLSPRSASTRLAAAVWWFFALIFISSYTANLAAFLTAERMITPIENADDLARQTKIKYGTLNRGSTMTFFKDSKVETYEKMWKLMESQSNLFVKSSKEGIKRVKNGDYAYLMESSMLEYALERDCELIQIGGLLDQKGYAFGLAKGSPYRKPISTTILRLQEKTVLTELKDKWWKKERGGGACSYKKLSQSEFGARSVGGIFLILTIGILISIFIALGELIAHVNGEKAMNNTDLRQLLLLEIKNSIKEKHDATTTERENHLTSRLDELIGIRQSEAKSDQPPLFEAL